MNTSILDHNYDPGNSNFDILDHESWPVSRIDPEFVRLCWIMTCWILVNRWNIWYICATSNTSILKASCTGNGCKRKNIRGSIRIKIQNSDSDYSRVVFWLFFRQHGIILFPKYWVLNKNPWVFDKELLSFEILLS